MKIHTDIPGWEYWYGADKSWWASRRDTDGNQVGDALFAHHKADLLFDIHRDDRGTDPIAPEPEFESGTFIKLRS